MEEIDYKIAVMQAYKEGKKIEYRSSVFNSAWGECPTPSWNWQDFDFRVKEEPKYRPYENAEEFLQAQKEHGMYVRLIHTNNIYHIPTTVYDDCVGFAVCADTEYYDWNELFTTYIWQDGTPCGIKE